MREHAKTGKMGQKWGLVRKAIKNYFFFAGRTGIFAGIIAGATIC